MIIGGKYDSKCVFSVPLKEWLSRNLRNCKIWRFENFVWQLLFSILCWLLWKKRNLFMFAITNNCARDLVDTGIVWARSFAHPSMSLPHQSHLVSTLHWSPSKIRWVKLKTNGAMTPNSRNASVGGVFKDLDARWLCGFSMTVAKNTIFHVEARAMLEGLHIAWDRGQRQLKIECANALLVECFLVGCTVNSTLAKLHLIHSFINRDWRI